MSYGNYPNTLALVSLVEKEARRLNEEKKVVDALTKLALDLGLSDQEVVDALSDDDLLVIYAP